jgi:hypothetical protein
MHRAQGRRDGFGGSIKSAKTTRNFVQLDAFQGVLKEVAPTVNRIVAFSVKPLIV